MNESVLVYTLNDIDRVAEALWLAGKHWNVWSLKGAMGAGKTTLVAAICRYLGVEDHISSPTYSLVQEYYSPAYGTLYHADWYRLRDETEAILAGMEEIVCQPKAHTFIEWAEKAPGLLSDRHMEINIEILDEHTRRAHLSWPLGE